MSHTAGIADNWGAMGAVVVNGDSPIALGDFRITVQMEPPYIR